MQEDTYKKIQFVLNLGRQSICNSFAYKQILLEEERYIFAWCYKLVATSACLLLVSLTSCHFYIPFYGLFHYRAVS